MAQEPNYAARDLWSQMFARAAEHPGAAIMDPEHDEAKDEAAARAGFAASGWSAEEVDAIIGAGAERRANAPSTSPGTNPAAEAFHAALCDDIETEMARQGLESQRHVARGIEPRTGPFASKAGVIMTEESIITVGAFTYRFCGLIAKAFVRTLNLGPFVWDADAYNDRLGRIALRRPPHLMLYWNCVYTSFAMTGTHVSVPFEPATKEEVWLVEQVARAMELFVVGHEYGHHHLGHGRTMGVDQMAEEFAADQFALRIGKPLGESERPIWNPFLASGAGGVIMLKALETLRRCEVELGGTTPRADTHPSVADRIERFDSVAVLSPQEFRMLKGFRTASARIMDLVDGVVADMMAAIPEDVRTSLVRMRSEIQAELPEGERKYVET